MLAVIRELEVQKHLLKDAKFEFEVQTDYKFDFTLKYMLRIRMGKVDRLSRRPDLKVGQKMIMKIRS